MTYLHVFIITIILVMRRGDALNLNLDSNSGNVQWQLENQNGSIKVPGTVPGGVYSDLQRGGLIGDILSGFNDVNTRWIAHEDSFTYTTQFKVKKEHLKYAAINLVLEGVDAISFVEVNDSPVGLTDNMYVRYVYDIKDKLKNGRNTLKLTFASPVVSARVRSQQHFVAPACVPDDYHGECHANQLRKMQASFGWDWGPAFPSVGIWKSAFIEYFNGAIIRSVTTHLEKQPENWHLKIKAYLESFKKNHKIVGYLKASLSLDAQQSLVVANKVEFTSRHDRSAEVEISMNVSQNVVSTWWPNGYGEQPLYDLILSFNTVEHPDEVHSKEIQIGFRTIQLIEEDASKYLGNTTAGKGLTFYFKVNGYPMFMKGSNWIPAHILPEFGYNETTVDDLLQSARSAHMSMLRVWGGGVYESDVFYRRCDQLGLLVWQDLMFACSMYPVDRDFLMSVKEEVAQNVLRLQHHPSVALWAGNNENEVALRGHWYTKPSEFETYKADYITLYVDTIRPIVEELDPQRRYLVSSPTNGLESEREGYIAENPYSPNYGDTHYYNYIADGWNFDIYPQTRFASEYGFQSLPSLATMRTATVKEDDFRIDSEYSKHRQHSPNGYEFVKNEINSHLKLDKDDPEYFEKFVFYSQISQAMAIKTETEFYRQNQMSWLTMGALYWQLNDVWQAPSWSSIEYGGRWKMLHYFAMNFFSPVLVSPRLHTTGDLDVYLLNDRLVPIDSAKVIVEIFNWTNFTPIINRSYLASARPLQAHKLGNVDLNIWNTYNRDEVFLRFTLDAEGMSSPNNYVFPSPLKNVKGLEKPNIKITVTNSTARTTHERTYSVHILVNKVVLFLWLEADGIQGHFDENGLILTQPYTTVDYHSKVDVGPAVLEAAISYRYYLN